MTPPNPKSQESEFAKLIDLAGVVVPVMTPLDAQGQVDRAAVVRISEHVLMGGVDGIFILGSCGEGPSLTAEHRRDVVAAFVSAVAGEVPVLGGLAETSVQRGLDAMSDLIDGGVDAIVVGTPFYFPGLSDEEVLAHFSSLISACDLPVVLYNIPQFTGNAITPVVLEALATEPSVIALKDSSGIWDEFTLLRALCHRHHLPLLQGAEALVARSVLNGAAGTMPGIANIVPGLVVKLVRAAQAGDVALALELQSQLDRVSALMRVGFWLTALKAAASELGICMPYTASTALPLDESQMSRVRSILADVREHEAW